MENSVQAFAVPQDVNTDVMTGTEKVALWIYSVYGLRLHTNQPIPGLIVPPQPGKADVEITFEEAERHHSQPVGAVEVYASPGITENGEPYFKVWKDDVHPQAYLGIQYTDGAGFTSFLINREVSQVQVARTESIPFQDMLTYFLGPVIGCVLRLREITCLHAGVAAVDGKALAIIGPKGAGKSTTVAALAHHSQAVLSDDIAPLSQVEGRFMVAPGYPCLRLWPNTIAALPGITTGELPKILSFAEKRFLSLTVDGAADRWRFQDKPLPLAAVYVLSGRAQDGALSITSQSQAAGLLALSGNVYPEYSLRQTDRCRDFGVLGQLAASVPVREVTQPEGLDTLAQLCDAILNDFQGL
jgi:hypothetical protein